eukprot:scaffold97783_cov21-Tisochrysis_lutea.AAC.5
MLLRLVIFARSHPICNFCEHLSSIVICACPHLSAFLPLHHPEAGHLWLVAAPSECPQPADRPC